MPRHPRLTQFVLSLGPSLLATLLHSGSRILAGCTAFVMFAAATGAQFAVHPSAAAGYLSDAVGLSTSASVFAAVLAALAIAGGAVVVATRHKVGGPG